mmetsp:Transcript_5467/g.13655  ORF Transcript_5467/g.13655 Transcript_5467/m.13655 type:complete len:209 (+) Transcript_5467:222-848(+)
MSHSSSSSSSLSNSPPLFIPSASPPSSASSSASSSATSPPVLPFRSMLAEHSSLVPLPCSAVKSHSTYRNVGPSSGSGSPSSTGHTSTGRPSESSAIVQNGSDRKARLALRGGAASTLGDASASRLPSGVESSPRYVKHLVVGVAQDRRPAPRAGTPRRGSFRFAMKLQVRAQSTMAHGCNSAAMSAIDAVSVGLESQGIRRASSAQW